MNENTTILRQGLACLLQTGRQGLLWIVNKRLPDVLVIDLVLFRNGQRLDHRCARYGSQLAELFMVIVLSWAEIGLACGQPCCNLTIEKSVSDTEASFASCKLIDVPFLRFVVWTE